MQGQITLSGNAGSDVRLMVANSGSAFATFRLAVTKRKLVNGSWQDAETTWYTVKAWRALAENIAESIQSGHPVLVTGRLEMESWSRDDKQYLTPVVAAVSVGHDLSRGRSSFQRVKPTEVDSGEDEAMKEAVHDWSDLIGDDPRDGDDPARADATANEGPTHQPASGLAGAA